MLESQDAGADVPKKAGTVYLPPGERLDEPKVCGEQAVEGVWIAGYKRRKVSAAQRLGILHIPHIAIVSPLADG